MCLAAGKVTPSGPIDHIIPHHGDPKLFFDRNNLQALCQPCHDSRKRQIEHYGHSQACSADGMPLDPGHAWFQEKAMRDKKRREDLKHKERKESR